MQHNKYFTNRFFFYTANLAIIFWCLQFSGCSENTPKPINKSETSKVAEADVLQGIPKAEKSELIIEKDLQTTLSLQKPPKIWFEFQMNNEIKIVEFSEETKQLFNTRWTEYFNYQFKMYSTFDDEVKSEIVKVEILKQLEFMRQIDLIQIDAPQNKRKISKDEVNKINNLFNDLLLERIEEIDDHFNPKSTIYKLKRKIGKTAQSVFEKLLPK